VPRRKPPPHPTDPLHDEPETLVMGYVDATKRVYVAVVDHDTGDLVQINEMTGHLYAPGDVAGPPPDQQIGPVPAILLAAGVPLLDAQKLAPAFAKEYLSRTGSFAFTRQALLIWYTMMLAKQGAS
jgi:hypothetical protein